MPLDLQVKLLRVLETGTFMRVGSTQVQETDVRIIAATNRNPNEAVTPASCAKTCCIASTCSRSTCRRCASAPTTSRCIVDAISSSPDLRARRRRQALRAGDVLERFAAYRWPGNVRELRNVVYRAYVMTPGATIDDDCLPVSAPARRSPARRGADR